MIVEEPGKVYLNQSVIWKKFESVFGTISGALCYDDVFHDFYYQALQELYDDNVQYIEFRTILPEVLVKMMLYSVPIANTSV